MQGHEETLGINGNVHYLDCGYSFACVCLCQNDQTVLFQCEHFFKLGSCISIKLLKD